jgi:hypothetical protein
MLSVISCESGFKQFRYGTTTLISPTDDVGVMQINRPTWSKKAKEMGLDIENSVEDNIEMGKFIYSVSGENAWVCSRLIQV